VSREEVRSLAGPALAALPKPPIGFILYFRNDTTELTPESREQLGKMQRLIRERGAVDISVVGHTDTMGTRKYNYPLSLRRARTVADLLIRGGVDPSVLEITSHGEDNPLVSTGDGVHEPRNRRVEVTVR
jgi:outer membrane protein OmpA-like peptidoglycan-associated protein